MIWIAVGIIVASALVTAYFEIGSLRRVGREQPTVQLLDPAERPVHQAREDYALGRIDLDALSDRLDLILGVTEEAEPDVTPEMVQWRIKQAASRREYERLTSDHERALREMMMAPIDSAAPLVLMATDSRAATASIPWTAASVPAHLVEGDVVELYDQNGNVERHIFRAR